MEVKETNQAQSTNNSPKRSEGELLVEKIPKQEVSAKTGRRRFTLEDKRRILCAADACIGKPGEIGALLRREGLYSSALANWRKARDRGEIIGLSPKKRGPQTKITDDRDRQIADLQKQNSRLQKRIDQAEAIIDIQKKVSLLLGIQLPAIDEASK